MRLDWAILTSFITKQAKILVTFCYLKKLNSKVKTAVTTMKKYGYFLFQHPVTPVIDISNKSFFNTTFKLGSGFNWSNQCSWAVKKANSMETTTNQSFTFIPSQVCKRPIDMFHLKLREFIGCENKIKPEYNHSINNSFYFVYMSLQASTT